MDEQIGETEVEEVIGEVMSKSELEEIQCC